MFRAKLHCGFVVVSQPFFTASEQFPLLGTSKNGFLVSTAASKRTFCNSGASPNLAAPVFPLDLGGGDFAWPVHGALSQAAPRPGRPSGRWSCAGSFGRHRGPAKARGLGVGWRVAEAGEVLELGHVEPREIRGFFGFLCWFPFQPISKRG